MQSDESGEEREGPVCSIPASISEHTKVLEPYLCDTYRVLEIQEMVEQEARKISTIKRNAKIFKTYSRRLFRQTKKELRLVPGMGKRVEILRSLHDNIGHWGVASTTQFVLTNYWWPTIH